MKKTKNSMYALLAGGFLLTVFTLNGCKEETKDPELPKIGGYNNSDEISSASLAAKWSFENSLTDSKQNLAGVSTNTTFTTGKKGQAYQGSSTGYVAYNATGTTFQGMTSFSVAFWINTTQHAEKSAPIFQILNSQGLNDWWTAKNLALYQEQGVTGKDSIFFKLFFYKDGAAYNHQGLEFNNENRIAGIVGKWSHLVFTYDEGTSKFYLYLNGVKKVLPDYFTNRFASEVVNGSQPPLGSLNFINATKFVFGGWGAQVATPQIPLENFMTNFDGKLDEFRVYKKALSQTEITALFELENAGR